MVDIGLPHSCPRHSSAAAAGECLSSVSTSNYPGTFSPDQRSPEEVLCPHPMRVGRRCTGTRRHHLPRSAPLSWVLPAKLVILPQSQFSLAALRLNSPLSSTRFANSPHLIPS